MKIGDLTYITNRLILHNESEYPIDFKILFNHEELNWTVQGYFHHDGVMHDFAVEGKSIQDCMDSLYNENPWWLR